METQSQVTTVPRILRISLIILTLFTAINHLFIGSNILKEPDEMMLGVLFILNGIGFIILLTGILTTFVPILSSNKLLSHYVMIVYTVVTVLAYVIMSGILSGEPPTLIALMTKVDELLLIAVTYLHLHTTRTWRGDNSDGAPR